ncbi:MAG TPA: hypothetical protein VGM06_24545 [Polyangiaceae bacterium]|jgi:hypothetical protein
MTPHENATEGGSMEPGGAGPRSARPSPTALAALSQMDLQSAFESAATLAVALTGSAENASEIATAAFERLRTEADAAHGQIVEHVLAVVRTLLRESLSPLSGPVPGGDGEGGQANLDLEELAARVAGHPLAPAVLRSRSEGVERASDIAQVLGVSVDDVHAAHKLLRHHLRQMRARGDEPRADGDPESAR